MENHSTAGGGVDNLLVLEGYSFVG